MEYLSGALPPPSRSLALLGSPDRQEAALQPGLPPQGKKRAIVAVAHSLPVAIYHILKEGTSYQKLGDDYFDKLNAYRLVPYLVRRTKDLDIR